MGFILIVIGFVLFPTLLDSFESMAYTEATTSRTVATGAGEANATIVLGNELYSDNMDYVGSVSSTLGTDDPAPAAYNGSTDTLTVSGLTANETRTLSVVYSTARDDSPIDIVRPIMPFFILMMFVIAGVGMIVLTFRR